MLPVTDADSLSRRGAQSRSSTLHRSETSIGRVHHIWTYCEMGRTSRTSRRTSAIWAAFAFALALGVAPARGVDVSGSAFFDVFGFELSASAAFDVVCEFINPFLSPQYQLSSCLGEETGAGDYDEPVEDQVEQEQGQDVVAGTVVDEDDSGAFTGGYTGNVAGGIGGAAIGGVAGGSGAALGSLRVGAGL